MRLPLSALRQELVIQGIPFSEDEPKRVLTGKLINAIMRGGEVSDIHSPAFEDLLRGFPPAEIPSAVVRITRVLLNGLSPTDIRKEALNRKLVIPDDVADKEEMIKYFMREVLKTAKKNRNSSYIIGGPYSIGMQRAILARSCRRNLGIIVEASIRGKKWEVFLNRDELNTLTPEEIVEEAWNQRINFNPREDKDEIINKLLLYYQTSGNKINIFSKPIRRRLVVLVDALQNAQSLNRGGSVAVSPLIVENPELKKAAEDSVGTSPPGLFVGSESQNNPGTTVSNISNSTTTIPGASPQITQQLPTDGALSFTRTPQGQSLVVGSTPVVNGTTTPIGNPVPIVMITPGPNGNMAYVANPTNVPTTINPQGSIIVGGQEIKVSSDSKGGQVLTINGVPVKTDGNGIVHQSGNKIVKVSDTLGILTEPVRTEKGLSNAEVNLPKKVLEAKGIYWGVYRKRLFDFVKNYAKNNSNQTLDTLIKSYEAARAAQRASENQIDSLSEELEQLWSSSAKTEDEIKLIQILKIYENDIWRMYEAYSESAFIGGMNVSAKNVNDVRDKQLAELRKLAKTPALVIVENLTEKKKQYFENVVLGDTLLEQMRKITGDVPDTPDGTQTINPQNIPIADQLGVSNPSRVTVKLLSPYQKPPLKAGVIPEFSGTDPSTLLQISSQAKAPPVSVAVAINDNALIKSIPPTAVQAFSDYVRKEMPNVLAYASTLIVYNNNLDAAITNKTFPAGGAGIIIPAQSDMKNQLNNINNTVKDLESFLTAILSTSIPRNFNIGALYSQLNTGRLLFGKFMSIISAYENVNGTNNLFKNFLKSFDNEVKSFVNVVNGTLQNNIWNIV